MSAGALDHLSMFGVAHSGKTKNCWELIRSWEQSEPLASGLENAVEFTGTRNESWGAKAAAAWDWDNVGLFQEKGGDRYLYERGNEWGAEIVEGVDLSEDGYKLLTKPFVKETTGGSPTPPCLSGIQEIVQCGSAGKDCSCVNSSSKPSVSMSQLETTDGAFKLQVSANLNFCHEANKHMYDDKPKNSIPRASFADSASSGECTLAKPLPNHNATLKLLDQESGLRNFGFQDHLKKDFLALRGGNSLIDRRQCKSEYHSDMHNYCSAADEGDGHIGLKLGKRTYFEESVGAADCKDTRMSVSKPSYPTKKQRGVSSVMQVPRCQVDTCKVDLSKERDYHRRHKVCAMHSKSPKVIAGGIEQRFCQQCSRFHVLSEFDEEKRSCRRRLAGHNERRRKPQANYTSIAARAVPGYESHFSGLLFKDESLPTTMFADPYFMQQQKSFSASSILDGTYSEQWNVGKTKTEKRYDNVGLKGQMVPDNQWLMLLQRPTCASTMGLLDVNQINPGCTHFQQAPNIPRSSESAMHKKSTLLGSQGLSEPSDSGCALSLLSSQAWRTKASNSLSLDLLPQSNTWSPQPSISKNQEICILGPVNDVFQSNENLLSNRFYSQKATEPSGGSRINISGVESMFGEQNHREVVPDVPTYFRKYSILPFQHGHPISENSNSQARPVIDLMQAAPATSTQDQTGSLALQGASPNAAEHFGEFQQFRSFGRTLN